MKWAVFIFLIISCTRSQPEISFDINGVRYSFVGNKVLETSGPGVFGSKSSPYYFIGGNIDTANVISIMIYTDTLQIGNYEKTAVVLKVGGNIYSFDASVNITSYKNGVVNGIFSAPTLSNGVIKNVRINY